MVQYQFKDGQVTVDNDLKAPLTDTPKKQFTESVVLLILGNTDQKKDSTQDTQKVEEEQLTP